MDSKYYFIIGLVIGIYLDQKYRLPDINGFIKEYSPDKKH